MRRSVLAVSAVTLLAACGGDSSVGKGVDLNVAEEAERAALGGSTTTVATTPSGDEGRAALGDTTTTAPPPTTTTEPQQQVAITISINADTAGGAQFDPSSARVYEGSLVEWVNKDSTARSIVFDDGSFNSGPIAPGASVRYEALAAGKFNYSDGTRPYAVGLLEVVPRG